MISARRSPSLYLILSLALLSAYFFYRSSAAWSVRVPARSSNLAAGSKSSSQPHSGNPDSSASSHEPDEESDTYSKPEIQGAANSTLGFGGLFVVSGAGSPRRNHLEQAAAVTELDLRIPRQKAWSDEDVRNWMTPNVNDSKVNGPGSVKAWLSHRLVLEEFLASGLETALIFEDDVDWDIRLRTMEVPRAQNAARTLTRAKDYNTDQYPWSPPSEWSLLWLGHCGDYFYDVQKGVGVGYLHPKDLTNIPHVLYSDPTVEYFTDLHPFTASELVALKIPPKTRVMHKSVWPLCSFAYAVSRIGARVILEDVAKDKEQPQHNQMAYDVALMQGCRDNRDLKCYTLTPELFHHMEGDSIIAGINETPEHHVSRPPVDAKGLAQVAYRKETSNIGCGFWSGEFYYDGVPEKLEFLRTEVGRKGRCLKEGRDENEENE